MTGAKNKTDLQQQKLNHNSQPCPSSQTNAVKPKPCQFPLILYDPENYIPNTFASSQTSKPTPSGKASSITRLLSGLRLHARMGYTPT